MFSRRTTSQPNSSIAANTVRSADGKRLAAESQADTRCRIVEATFDLHTELGPSRTSISTELYA